jgi:hypothetical protein
VIDFLWLKNDKVRSFFFVSGFTKPGVEFGIHFSAVADNAE